VWSTRDFHGRTRAVPHRLRPSADQDGYLSVSLCLRGKRRARKVAALVLEAFVGPAPAGTESCHHPDPSPTNNRLDNLRWATHQGNIDDKVALGRQARGVGHGSAKLTEDEVREVRITAGTLQEIADRYGVSTFCVWAIRTGKTWKHLR
jgi:hypothetical protein